MSQGYSTSKVTIVDGNDNQSLYNVDFQTTSGELEVQGFNNCPFCMKTDELSLTWEKQMTQRPPYEYIFDVTLLCRGCGVMMDENGMDMAGAISSLHERWNKRPNRDDFSRELLKARMYDKQETWMKDELVKWGPFTMEDMEQYFHCSIYELIAAVVSLKGTTDKQHYELKHLQEHVWMLIQYAEAATRGEGNLSRNLEQMFYRGAPVGSGSIGSAYLNGQMYPIVHGNPIVNNDGSIYWSGKDSIRWGQVNQERVTKEAYDKAIENMQQMGASMGQAFNGFAENFRASFVPAVKDMFEEMHKHIPPELLEELQETIQSQARKVEREKSKQKAFLRSQRNQPRHQLVDKRAHR